MKPRRGDVFNQTGIADQYRSAFDLSYEKKLTFDMGNLIPMMCDEAIPGDVWDIGNRAVIRFQPLVAPVLHAMKMRTYYFFVPYRLLFDQWEEFITRGTTGNSDIDLPIWDPDLATAPTDVTDKTTLWDYMGFPTGIVPPPSGCPLDFPRRAYYFIWNEYFRDQNLQSEIDFEDPNQWRILNKNWQKDYFTSALPFQQRGTAPALPIVGDTSVEFDIPQASDYTGNTGMMWAPTAAGLNWVSQTLAGSYYETPAALGDSPSAAAINADFNTVLSDNNVVSGAGLSSVDIADLRLAFQTQVWMERNARAGVRYTEFLHAHFGVSPRDDRLQRPEFIGGTSNPVIISEVLQTSEDGTTPQGNLAGHGITVQSANVGRYRVQEYGLIMGIACVTPVTAYQQGVNRQWLRRETFDFPFPEFAGLSEQEIFYAELKTIDQSIPNSNALNRSVFGFTGRYNEMRYKPTQVCADMRDTYAYWHLGRIWDSGDYPSLNTSFVTMNPRKDIFAVPSEPGLIGSFGNVLNVLRPIPFMAEPMSLGG